MKKLYNLILLFLIFCINFSCSVGSGSIGAQSIGSVPIKNIDNPLALGVESFPLLINSRNISSEFNESDIININVSSTIYITNLVTKFQICENSKVNMFKESAINKIIFLESNKNEEILLMPLSEMEELDEKNNIKYELSESYIIHESSNNVNNSFSIHNYIIGCIISAVILKIKFIYNNYINKNFDNKPNFDNNPNFSDININQNNLLFFSLSSSNTILKDLVNINLPLKNKKNKNYSIKIKDNKPLKLKIAQVKVVNNQFLRLTLSVAESFKLIINDRPITLYKGDVNIIIKLNNIKHYLNFNNLNRLTDNNITMLNADINNDSRILPFQIQYQNNEIFNLRLNLIDQNNPTVIKLNQNKNLNIQQHKIWSMIKKELMNSSLL